MEGFKSVKLAYNTHEPATGADETLAPIIYLHGLSALKEYWVDIPQRVADATKRKSYSVDARNHGDSEWSDHFNFDVNAEDLLHFLDTMDIPKAVLVGHSMGGVTAIKTALKRPERVESIVVEDMFVKKCPYRLIDKVSTFLMMMRKAVEDIPEETGEEEAKKLIFQHLRNSICEEVAEDVEKKLDDPLSNIDLLLLARNEEGRYVLKCNMEVIERALKDPETLASEPEGVFEGPALFIYGMLSPFEVGDNKEHIQQFFPSAVFEGIEAADHSIHLTNCEEFTDSLLKFLS